MLAPLQELSGIPHGDIRQRQLECVLQVLHSSGETLQQGWPLVLGVIGAVNKNHKYVSPAADRPGRPGVRLGGGQHLNGQHPVAEQLASILSLNN